MHIMNSEISSICSIREQSGGSDFPECINGLMNMKKILIATALAGFIRSFLEPDIHILQSMGFEVHCAAKNYPYDESIGEYFADLGVLFHQIDFSSNKPFSKQTFTAYRQFKALIESVRFDAVHLHTPIPGVIGRVVCAGYRCKGLKVFYTTHGFYFHKKADWKTKLVYGTIEQEMSRLTDAIITINREDYQVASKMHCSKVFYVPGMGVDIRKYRDTVIDRKVYRNQLGIPEEAFLILAVGELSRRKNHRVVIEALAKCGIPNAVFAICGRAVTDDNTSAELRVLAEKYRIDLRLLGYRKDIPQLCKCADIGVLPSSREGLGLSGIEMLASGLPIVASDVHGIVDYVKDGYNGYLADPFSAEEFSAGILKLTDNEKRKRIAENCSGSVEGFDKERSAEAVADIYRKMLDCSE